MTGLGEVPAAEGLSRPRFGGGALKELERGYAALVAAHGRNLRNALCVEMLKALR